MAADPHGTRLARARQSLDGLSVGDAFGERYFGTTGPERIAARALKEAPWGWTDDTAMALSIVAELAEGRGIESASLARRFAVRYASDPRRGYGGGAHDILAAIARGVPHDLAAGGAFDGQGSMGNGAAMRVAPVGAYFADDLAAVIEHARRSAAPTHAHPDGAGGAIAVAVAAAAAANGDASLLALALEHTPSGPTRDGLERAAALSAETSIAAAVTALGNGSRVICSDTVPFSIFCAERHRDDYVEALWATVSGLGDRDTTCAIVGGIVALSSPTIPEAWRRAREPLPEV